MKIVTCIAPVNIAVIKYWGKRDENLILPTNDSISGTLSTDYMCAKTTVMVSPTFEEDKFWLNGNEVGFDNERLNNCLREVKARANPNSKELLNWKVHICSENNFPTAAGLASSAAGYACLVYALTNLYQVEGDISRLARLGSGSACRSVYGGWVHWHQGALTNGDDSIATQIAPASHWPEIRVLVLVVSDNQKKVTSTSGMRQSVKTSEFLKCRIENVLPKRVEEMVQAIRSRNFEAFAEITMKDSNQFHSVCLDTFPPCFYMNDVSRAIIEVIQAYNEYRGSNKVAYTFDAGPNACLYLLEKDVPEVLSLITQLFPCDCPDDEFIRGCPIDIQHSKKWEETLRLKCRPSGSLRYVIHTKLGDGPKLVTNISECLLNENGFPKTMIHK